MSRKKVTEALPAPFASRFGVDQGMDLSIDAPGWASMHIIVGAVLELCFLGSSAGVGSAAEEWCAILVQEVTGDANVGGWIVRGKLLGSENAELGDEVDSVLGGSGTVHLCSVDPCPHVDELVVHFTRCRLWAPSRFEAAYLTTQGKRELTKAKKLEEQVMKSVTLPEPPKKREPRRSLSTRGRGRGNGRTPVAPEGAPSRRPPVITVPSEGEEGLGDDEETDEVGAERREHLRGILKQTRERILGGEPSKRRRVHFADDEALDGGRAAAGSGRAAADLSLVAGTHLKPGRMTPLQLAESGRDTREGDIKNLKKKIRGMGDTASSLVVQAVQQSSKDAELRKKKRKDKEKKDGVSQLLDLLKGKNRRKKRERKRGRKSQEGSPRRPRIKPDPDGSGGSDSSDYGSSSSSESRGRGQGQSDDNSDLDLEAPLRRKALKEPGSVMGMLVKHAQEQLDQGSLIETPDPSQALTRGVKIATYFSLLIRPYYPAGSPLLRELFAMSQAIDLLRSGRLAETADALASRFIAVHTALAEGSWATASQLEMYPLEPTQAATTATLLEAHKHRRLVLKSQGYYPGGRAWGGGGKGRGNFQSEKGKKGDGRGRGKGKGKHQGKEQTGGGKGGHNPWRENKEEAAPK
eukprot:s557_g5.t1